MQVAATPSMLMSLSAATFVDGDGVSGRSPLVVVDRDIDDLRIPAVSAGTLSGTIKWDAAGSQDSFTTREEVRLTLEPVHGDTTLGLPSTSVGALPGRFALSGLLPGRYRLILGSPKLMLKAVMWQGDDYTRRPFEALPGVNVSGVAVEVTDKACDVTGTITDVVNRRADGVAIVFFSQDKEDWLNYGLTQDRAGVVYSRQARYSIPRLPAGDYFIVAVRGRVPPLDDVKFLESISMKANRITLRWGESGVRDLSPVDIGGGAK